MMKSGGLEEERSVSSFPSRLCVTVVRNPTTAAETLAYGKVQYDDTFWRTLIL